MRRLTKFVNLIDVYDIQLYLRKSNYILEYYSVQ